MSFGRNKGCQGVRLRGHGRSTLHPKPRKQFLLRAGAEQAHHMRSEGFMHGNNQSWPCYVLEVHMTSNLTCWLGSPRKALLESKLYLLTFVSNRAYILNCQIFISQPGYPKCPQPPTCQTPAKVPGDLGRLALRLAVVFFFLPHTTDILVAHVCMCTW